MNKNISPDNNTIPNENILKALMRDHKNEPSEYRYNLPAPFYFMKSSIPVIVKSIFIEVNKKSAYNLYYIMSVEAECNKYTCEFERVVWVDILMKYHWGLITTNDFPKLLLYNIYNYCKANKLKKDIDILNLFYVNNDLKVLRKLNKFIKHKLMPSTLLSAIYS